MIFKALEGTLYLIKFDYSSNPLRFIVEFLAWLLSIGCAFVMALTIPDPPFLILYPIWILGCLMYSWAAYSRKSFGMLANYILLVTIDSTGYIRLFL
jgi:hypothetical protein